MDYDRPAKCDCKNKNRLTCITLRNTDGTANGTVSRLVGTVNVEPSYYAFDLGASFSLHRNKPCTIRVCSGSVGFDNTAAAYGSTQIASLDIMTNIQVQGLNKSIPHFPSGQVVQCELDVSTTNQPSGNGHSERIFRSTQPYETAFRCQALPDQIHLMMSRVEFKTSVATAPFTITAPNFITLTLEVEFDE
jgi:hypothetical protein